MSTKLKKPNRKRLAPLSALGAGAIGMTAGTAEASSIVYSGILDERVRYGAFGSVTFAGPNGVGAALNGTSRTAP